MYKIFIIEHNHLLAKTLTPHLEESGRRVFKYQYDDFMDDLLCEEIKLHSPGIVILDLINSANEGNRVCRAVKSEDKMTQIIAIVGDAVLKNIDFRHGFDDFTLMTDNLLEIQQRIRLIEFKNNLGENPDNLICGKVEINVASYEIRVADEPVELTYKEFELLKFFMKHPGRVYNRDVLLNQIWGFEYYGGTRTVDVHIRRLRFKLGQEGKIIKTVRNVGYKVSTS